MTLLVIVAAMLLAAVPATPEKQAESDPHAAAVDHADQLVSNGKLGEATVILDPALDAYRRRFGSEKRAIYCSSSTAETLLYLMEAATAKKLVHLGRLTEPAQVQCDRSVLRDFK
eukprot:gene32085-42820_t